MSHVWFIFIISALCVFRIALMFSEEEGPAAIFSKMRRKVPAKTNPGRGIRCIFCWSIWIAAIITGYLYYLGEIPLKFTPIYWFALSGLVVGFNKHFKKE